MMCEVCKTFTTNYGQRTNSCSINGFKSKCLCIISDQRSLVWSNSLITRCWIHSTCHCHNTLTNPRHLIKHDSCEIQNIFNIIIATVTLEYGQK